MFAKKLSEVTSSDIQSILEQKVQEDQEIEFKEALSTADGSPDKWMSDGESIGNQAKRAIAKELIAFANAMGGVLILGIAEDDEGRASGINLLPNCRSLAERLAASVASSTDPKIIGIEYAGVEIEGDKGIAIFRVNPSARAPHRDKDSRESYYRTGTMSEPMEMARIQNLSVEKWRGLRDIESRLHSRTFAVDRKFVKAVSIEKPSGSSEIVNVDLSVCSIRATAVPLERIFINDIAKTEFLKLVDPPLELDMGNQKSRVVSYPDHVQWTPVLRGIRRRNVINDDWEQLEERTILADGLIEIRAKTSELLHQSGAKYCPAKWLLEPVVHFLVMVEALRNLIGRPELGFAISIEWHIPIGASIKLPEELWHHNLLHAVEEANVLPDLQMPRRENIQEFWLEIENEFFQSLGKTYGNIFPYLIEKAIRVVIESSKARS